jgi:guanine deaminase
VKIVQRWPEDEMQKCLSYSWMDPEVLAMKKTFMKRAIELALNNVTSHAGGPFGAVIVKDENIISEGTNLVTSSCDPTAHAEILAIRKACQKLNTFNLSGCDIYTSCEPCPMCLAGIYWARLERLFYAGSRNDAAQNGFDDDFFYKELNKPQAQRHIPIEQFMRNEAQSAFEAWRNSDKKIAY